MFYVSLHTGRHTKGLSAAIKCRSLQENNALNKPYTKWHVVSYNLEMLVARIRGLLQFGI